MASFDTLTATEDLRNAGADERFAKAIVRVVQHSAEWPKIDHLATKEQLENLGLATRQQIAQVSDRVDAVDKRLSARIDMLQAVVFVGIGLNLVGFLGVAGFLYTVLKHA